MQINTIAGINSFQNSANSINFKQGLTRDIVTHVKNMPPDEYQRIVQRLLQKYDMSANVGCSNTVAFCVEQTADIMSRAGFTLPKKFKFGSLGSNRYLGEYKAVGTVVINSSLRDFLDLAQLNKMEEKSNSHNCSKHFLDTYLHEFLHAAHLNNIVKLTNSDMGRGIFFGDLSKFKPCDTLENPIISFITHLFPTMTKKQAKDIFPIEKKLFCTSDLSEYFVEKNAKILENQLGEDLNTANIQQNMATNYTAFPEDWNINNEINKITEIPLRIRILYGKLNPAERDKRIEETIKNLLNYFEGEIWNGNIDGIKDKSSILRDYGIKHANK